MSLNKPAESSPATLPNTVHADKLLAAAAHLFRTKGYSAATTRELAAVLGIQKASLYHHMARKEDLLYELIRTALGRSLQSAEVIVSSDAPVLDRLRELLVTHVITLLKEPDQYSTMLLELRVLTGERRTQIVRMRDTYESLVRGLVAAGQREGRVRTDHGAADLTRALLGMVNYPVFWYLPERGSGAEQIAQMIADVALEGIVVDGIASDAGNRVRGSC